jgi:hypothetical protein
VEAILNEQSSIIEEYHKYLKEVVEANDKLEKQVSYYKKENAHSQSYTVLPKSSSAQKNRVDDYSNSAIYISEPSTTEGRRFLI